MHLGKRSSVRKKKSLILVTYILPAGLLADAKVIILGYL